jgi:hypothetical protein
LHGGGAPEPRCAPVHDNERAVQRVRILARQQIQHGLLGKLCVPELRCGKRQLCIRVRTETKSPVKELGTRRILLLIALVLLVVLVVVLVVLLVVLVVLLAVVILGAACAVPPGAREVPRDPCLARAADDCNHRMPGAHVAQPELAKRARANRHAIKRTNRHANRHTDPRAIRRSVRHCRGRRRRRCRVHVFLLHGQKKLYAA